MIMAGGTRVELSVYTVDVLVLYSSISTVSWKHHEMMKPQESVSSWCVHVAFIVLLWCFHGDRWAFTGLHRLTIKTMGRGTHYASFNTHESSMKPHASPMKALREKK